MANIYTKTEVNGLTTLTNFYNKTTTDALLNTKQPNHPVRPACRKQALTEYSLVQTSVPLGMCVLQC